jgi:hypothetical protein
MPGSQRTPTTATPSILAVFAATVAIVATNLAVLAAIIATSLPPLAVFAAIIATFAAILPRISAGNRGKPA